MVVPTGKVEPEVGVQVVATGGFPPDEAGQRR